MSKRSLLSYSAIYGGDFHPIEHISVCSVCANVSSNNALQWRRRNGCNGCFFHLLRQNWPGKTGFVWADGFPAAHWLDWRLFIITSMHSTSVRIIVGQAQGSFQADGFPATHWPEVSSSQTSSSQTSS